MNESDILRLINKHIDEEITDEEKQTLDRLLGSDKKYRQLYDDMQQSVKTMNETPMIDPPASLTENIVSKIDPGRYQKSTPMWQKINTVVSEFIRPRRQMAVAFACGLLIGAVCIGLFVQPESYSVSDISGTIGTDQSSTVDQFTMQSEGLTSEFQLERTSSGLICRVKMNTEHPFDLMFKFDSPEYRLSRYQTDSPEPVQIQTKPSEIRLSAQSGMEIGLIIDAENTRGDELSIHINCNNSRMEKNLLF